MEIFKLNKVAVLLFVSLLFFNPSAQAETTDPLNPAEIVRAGYISGSGFQAKSRSMTANKSSETPELLLIERHPTDKNKPDARYADVYQYDYKSNETIHTVVDLTQQKTISTKRQQHLQLPLTENEITQARQIALADDEQRALIEQEFQRITGHYLTQPDQLNIKAFVFTAETLPEQLNPASKQCGLHRCAQILLYTHDSVVFEISPIVNLSAGIVTQNIGY